MRVSFWLPLTLAWLLLLGCQEKPREDVMLKMHRLGARIQVDEQSPGTPVVSLSFNHILIADRDLIYLQGFTRMQALDLSFSGVTDAGLPHLRGLTQLHVLDLTGTLITDQGLDQLKGLNQLQTLYLSETQITDAGLDHLLGLSQLQTLYLNGTRVTGQGVQEFRKALPKTQVSL